MPSILNPTDADVLRGRFAKLTPDAPAQFGKFNAPRMVCHLIDAYRNALGENNDTPFTGHILSNSALRWLIINVIPFPKGKAPTAPSYLATKPASWDADCTRWRELFDRVAARRNEPTAAWGVHPAFGYLNAEQWGKLIYKHTAHHLGQFGV